ncbi:hypothetical protein QE152_g10364 [Popillia japonica]|uniref:Uncharacterized protein n=1 Tax=Popillia japonica TaxID=7064 RepID=A0AAW1LTQ5_POPJA
MEFSTIPLLKNTVQQMQKASSCGKQLATPVNDPKFKIDDFEIRSLKPDKAEKRPAVPSTSNSNGDACNKPNTDRSDSTTNTPAKPIKTLQYYKKNSDQSKHTADPNKTENFQVNKNIGTYDNSEQQKHKKEGNIVDNKLKTVGEAEITHH